MKLDRGKAMQKIMREIPVFYLSLCAVLTFSVAVSARGQIVSPIADATTASATVSPKSHQFANQAIHSTSVPISIGLTNTQSSAITISSITVSAPFSQTNNCGSSLAAGKSCYISVRFAPTAVAYYTADLVITDTATGSPQRVALSGNGVVPIATVPKAASFYFYNQIVKTPSSPQTLSLTNNESYAVTVSSITTSADYPFTSDCVGSLASGATCSVHLTFVPQATGSRPATLTIAESAYGGPLSFPLQGSGIAGSPGLTVNVAPYGPCVLPSETQQFSAIVTGTTNKGVNWYVDYILNGSSSTGTITPAGLYTAPANSGTHVIKAVSQVSNKVAGSTAIEVTSAPNLEVYPYVASIPVGGETKFQSQRCSVPYGGPVSFSVDNIPGGNSTVGTVTSTGLYTAPAIAGKHTVRLTDTTLNKSTGAVVNVFSSISADFGSRTNQAHPVPADMFGTARGEGIHSDTDRNLLTQAGLTTSRINAAIPYVYKTTTPDWTKIDPFIASIKNTGEHPILQMTLTPPWLEPSPNPCGAGAQTVVPSDINKWAQIAVAYVAHMDAAFPNFVQDYEIWNEPNAAGMCATDHLGSYMAIYAAAAPAMKAQAQRDGKTIRIGGPALSNYSHVWLNALLTTASTAPYVDFVSYHQYFFGSTSLQVEWDKYNGNMSLYQAVQEPSSGAVSAYNKVLTDVAAGKQPLGAKTPVYISEFNSNWAFFKDCCRNDPTYAPLFNSLYVTYLLNSVYSGTVSVPKKLIYFADTAYPWFCTIGVQDANMDCLYSTDSDNVPYPQYYAFQLLASPNYLGLASGGYMASSVSPASGGGGLVTTAFYNSTQDAVVIINPTPTAYSAITVDFANVGFATPHGTLYEIVNGASISSSSVALSAKGSGFSATVSVPAYSVQAISLKAQ